MQNKLIFIIIFGCLCVSVFAESSQAERIRADSFISNFYWYQKYLPQENIAKLYTVYNAVLFLQENNTGEFEKLGGTLNTKIVDLDAKVFARLKEELMYKNNKMKILLRDCSDYADTRRLKEQYADFQNAVFQNTYPEDDYCLDVIEQMYSERITDPNYKLVQLLTETYTTVYGDYFRKTAAKPEIYGDEMEWRIALMFCMRNSPTSLRLHFYSSVRHYCGAAARLRRQESRPPVVF